MHQISSFYMKLSGYPGRPGTAKKQPESAYQEYHKKKAERFLMKKNPRDSWEIMVFPIRNHELQEVQMRL